MPARDEAHIDTKSLGLALSFDSPKSKNNRHRSKWLVKFDTGIEMLVPDDIFTMMTFHLEEA